MLILDVLMFHIVYISTVANKWIREHANFLRRPCSTNPQE